MSASAGYAGFSLVEAMIATAVTLAVVGSVSAMLHPAHAAFAVEPETADMQQRLRVAADSLTRDIAAAGAGPMIGDRPGPLIRSFAPVLPFRHGVTASDPPGTALTDTIALVSIPATAAQAALAADLLPGALTLQLAPAGGCAPGTNLCGFTAGMTIAVYDDTGSVATFVIARVDDATAEVTVTIRPAATAATTFPRGSQVAQVRIDTYALKADAASQAFQLMHADGSAGGDVPAVDHVVALAFEYAGEPRAPTLSDAGRTSYGPAPPAIGRRSTEYPAGENCLFRVDEVSGLQVPRLPSLNGPGALVPLPLTKLSDGPWCPDEAAANRWDADLLRIRTVRALIRVEAALSALRGPAGVLFANPGSARAANRWAPDREIRIQVSPRNLNLRQP